MMMVWASPFLLLTSRNPSAPAPPDLLTTMSGRGESLCFSAMPAISRAIWSAPPPVPAGTTNSIGLVGSQATAEAGSVISSVRPSAPTASSFIARSFARGPASGPCRMECASNTYTTRKGRDPFRGRPALPAKSGEEEQQAIPALLRRQRRLRRVEATERHHRRNLPLLPHLVDLRLEVIEVLLDEVGESPLLQEVLAHRLPGASLDDRLGLAVVLHMAVFDLVEREDPGLDGQLAELVRQHRVVVPALRGWIERVDERRAPDRQRAPHLVHHLHRVRGADRRHVAALRMAGRHQAGHVLLPPRVDEAFHLPGRAERGVGAIRRHPGELDVGVGVRLVVVEEDQRVVLLVRQSRRDRAEPHVGAAAVAAEGDDDDRLRLHLSLAHERLETCGGPERG